MLVAHERARGAQSDANAYTSRLLEIVLPHGGVAIVMEAYFDESGTHEGSPVITVAGYIFEADQCRRLTDSWAETLRKYDLAYFRMSECANGTGEFKKLTKPQRIAAEKSMISHIKTRMTYGVAVSMSQAEFTRMAPPHFVDVFGDAYTACVFLAMASVGYWARKRNYEGDVAYFFESGHAQMSEAQKRLGILGGRPERRAEFRYGSHAFAEKKLVLPLQAADLLAWQWRKAFINLLNRRLPRLDLVALVENSPHGAHHFTGDLLRRFMQGSIDNAEREFMAGLDGSGNPLKD